MASDIMDSLTMNDCARNAGNHDAPGNGIRHDRRKRRTRTRAGAFRRARTARRTLANSALATVALTALVNAAVGAVYVLDAPDAPPTYASHPTNPGYRLLATDQDPRTAVPIAHGTPAAGPGSPSARLDQLVERIALRQRVDPALVHAVIEVESRYRPDAVSPRGAVGVMQLMPATARRYGVTNRSIPEQNIEGGVAYLRDLLARFHGNVALALAAYNAGEHAVERHGRVIPAYRETMLYVPQVLEAYARRGNAARASDR